MSIKSEPQDGADIPVDQDGIPKEAPGEDEEDLLDELYDNLKEASDDGAEFREEAEVSFGMRDGMGQWDQDDLDLMNEQERPVVTFNRIAPIVDVVTGMELQNRQEVRYVPRRVGTARVSDDLTAASNWVKDTCSADEEESEAFRDMVTCGMGWTETTLDYTKNPDGEITIERIDPMEMRWDPSSKKKNLSDANYVMRIWDVTEDWVKDQWPDKADEIENMQAMNATDSISVTMGPEPGDDWKTPDGVGVKPEEGMMRIVDYQRRKLETFWRVKDPQTGKLVSVSEGQWAKIKKNAERIGLPLKAIKQKKYHYYRAYAVGRVLLEDKECPDPSSFTYKPMTGRRDRNEGRWYGLVRGAQDPQRWANKWLAQTMWIFNNSAKGGAIVEKDAVDNIRAFEETYPDPSVVTVVKPGGAAKITPKVSAPFPAQLNNLMEFAISSIRDVTGVSVELLGMANREQPLGLEMQRKQAGVTILAAFFDAIKMYRREQGKLMLYLIQNYISDGRLIRVLGQGEMKYLPLLRDPEIIDYDIIVDDAPNSVNMKERTWAVLQQLIPMLQPLGVPLTEEMLDYLPLPDSLVMAWKQKMAPTPEQQQQKQLQMAGAEANVQKVQADAAKSMAEADRAKADAEMRRSEANAPPPEPDPKKTFDMLQSMAKADLAVTQNAGMGIGPGQSAMMAQVPDPIPPGKVPQFAQGGSPKSPASVDHSMAGTPQSQPTPFIPGQG
jgi:Phage P22-like portal protein